MLKTFVLAAAGCVAVGGFTAGAQGMGPGTVSRVDGQAALDGKALMTGSEGTAALQAGQMLSTGNGRAEIILTPGVVLRMDRSSVVKMVKAESAHSEVMLESGRADVVVGDVSGRRDLEVDTANGVQTSLLKPGLYDFDAKAGELKVYDGKAAVSRSADGKWIDVKSGQQLALSGAEGKASDFQSSEDRQRYYAAREEGFGYRAGGAEYAPGEGYPYQYGYGPGYGFGGPLGYGFYPGFYPGFFYGGGFGYGYGFGGGYFGGFRGGYGGFLGRRR